MDSDKAPALQTAVSHIRWRALEPSRCDIAYDICKEDRFPREIS